MGSGEAWLDNSGLCESWQCWQWPDWAVLIVVPIGLYLYWRWAMLQPERNTDDWP